MTIKTITNLKKQNKKLIINRLKVRIKIFTLQKSRNKSQTNRSKRAIGHKQSLMMEVKIRNYEIIQKNEIHLFLDLKKENLS